MSSVVAIDLTSGKRLWVKNPNPDSYQLMPVSTDGKSVLVIDAGDPISEKNPRLLRFSLADGSFDTVAELPMNVQSMTSKSIPHVKDDRLFLVPLIPVKLPNSPASGRAVIALQ